VVGWRHLWRRAPFFADGRTHLGQNKVQKNFALAGRSRLDLGSLRKKNLSETGRRACQMVDWRARSSPFGPWARGQAAYNIFVPANGTRAASWCEV
jgi:hypothetical protein